MKLSDFDYTLPKELIAQYPLKERDAARLLVLDRKKSTIEHRIFKDIIDYLHKDDLLVLNDTKVLRSRLKGSRLTGGKVELLLLGRKEGTTFDALIKPRRIKVGEKIIFNGSSISGIVSAKNEITFSGGIGKYKISPYTAGDGSEGVQAPLPRGDRERSDRQRGGAPRTKKIPSRGSHSEQSEEFSCLAIDAVYNLGKMPLPPYIKREPEDLDNIYYQTVYAQKEGAVASPTAGLHFTKELVEKIQSLGINMTYITLHIGYATFRPVKNENITEHKMGKEYFKISDDVISCLEQTRARKDRIFAVGTTTCRTLETYASGLKEGYTDLFIYPGYRFKMTDYLLTNFHLPRTTLFMLVCAFASRKLIKKAYQEAIDKKYRFYSYGDAMLIL